MPKYMPKYINGPYNYVQLSGNINNINKNITLFMDVHLDINNQTRCDSFDSSDISQYLYKLIKDTKIPFDFFLEVREEQIKEPITDKREIYIAEVIEMFKTEFIVEKDKVKYSKSNPYVRLHYLDIRDHLQFHHITKQLKKGIFPILNSLKNGYELSQDNSNKINKLEQIKQHIDNIKIHKNTIFKKYINIYNNITKFDKKTQEYYINKILHEYKYDNVKKTIKNFFEENFIKFSSKFDEIISQFNSYIEIYQKNFNNTSILSIFYILYNKLYNILMELYALITDVYFLRRFLDKDYIQNVITYCGRNHALNYIYFLVKYCNFTITKIYDTNGLTIDDIINKIKETDDLNKVYNLFLFEGEKPKQCVEKPHYNFLLGW